MQTCTYADSTWSAAERRAVDIREVEKPYAALTDDERDEGTGCSICREDQVEIALPGVAPFEVCIAVAGVKAFLVDPTHFLVVAVVEDANPPHPEAPSRSEGLEGCEEMAASVSTLRGSARSRLAPQGEGGKQPARERLIDFDPG